MYDAIILSDLHIGAPACKNDKIEKFLEDIPPTKVLILNGDVIHATDRRLTKKHWHTLSCLRKLSDKIKVVWVAGNHDWDAEVVANLIGVRFAETAYSFRSGSKSFVCLHGHQFDSFILKYPKLSWLADKAHLLIQKRCSWLARLFKHKSKFFLRNSGKVAFGAKKYADQHGYDFVICGHTHAVYTDYRYANSGCWTDGCTYLAVKEGIVELHECL